MSSSPYNVSFNTQKKKGQSTIFKIVNDGQQQERRQIATT